jgi:quercetin dioxygenase-like cupin family protein
MMPECELIRSSVISILAGSICRLPMNGGLQIEVAMQKIIGTFMHPIQVPNDGGKKVNILGIPMSIRIHGRDTGGVVSTVESHDVTGGGPPPHIHHREDETFQILEGEYEWTVGGKTFIAQKGATIFAPRGIPHTYRYLGQTPGRLMCIITPSGFEGFFEEIGALSPQQQQDIPRVIEIAKKYGMEILPPPNP